jgi:hypothetical protein
MSRIDISDWGMYLVHNRNPETNEVVCLGGSDVPVISLALQCTSGFL